MVLLALDSLNMSIERRQFPQFFITAPTPCPYLPERQERKVFTHLVGSDACQLHDVLSNGGFRRSQNIAYRPACEDCAACVSIRVPVDSFQWTKSFTRIYKKNRDLNSRFVEAKVAGQHYSLFSEYINSRHRDGGMSDMTVLDFSAMVDESPVKTNLIEYHQGPQVPLADPDPQQGPLVAVALTDTLSDGLSMIYSFFSPNLPKRSLGTYMILDHIVKAKKLGLPYVYLGFWIEGSEKMAYKARFLPQERLTDNGWCATG